MLIVDCFADENASIIKDENLRNIDLAGPITYDCANPELATTNKGGRAIELLSIGISRREDNLKLQICMYNYSDLHFRTYTRALL